jgi:hypothetical protein
MKAIAMGRTCGIWRSKKSVQNFGEKIGREEIARRPTCKSASNMIHIEVVDRDKWHNIWIYFNCHRLGFKELFVFYTNKVGFNFHCKQFLLITFYTV